MFNPTDTRLKYDNGSYQESVERSIYSGAYQLMTPYNDCNECMGYVNNDPNIRFQAYGQNFCSMSKAIDDNTELSGRNYKNSKCNSDAYMPNKYISTGCMPKVTDGMIDIRKCATPVESTRLSNPPCTLKSTGINRFDPLCWNPQDKAIEGFDRIGINNRMVVKDNHVPLIERPDDQNKFMPLSPDMNKDYSADLGKWAELNKNNNYAPGYAYTNYNNLLPCK